MRGSQFKTTWGANFSEDTVLDNWWANRKALVISDGNYDDLRTNVEDLLQAQGLTVTISTDQSAIDTFELEY